MTLCFWNEGIDNFPWGNCWKYFHALAYCFCHMAMIYRTWTILYRKPLTWKRNFSWISLFKTNSPKWINFSTWVNNGTFLCVRCMKPAKGENLTGLVTARRCRNHNSTPWGLHISRLTSSPSSLPRAVCDHSISSECCTAQSFRAASLSNDRKSLLARKAVNSLPLESNTEKLQFFPEWSSYYEGKKILKGVNANIPLWQNSYLFLKNHISSSAWYFV